MVHDGLTGVLKAKSGQEYDQSEKIETNITF